MKTKRKIVKQCRECRFQIEIEYPENINISIGKIRDGIEKHDNTRDHPFIALSKNLIWRETDK